ncbi:MAG: hypothetical protein J0G96_07285 [Flavobacteriia bacterium]|nr:hypothetical protein [Flavobacteriia bacterium]OJX36669.1 MAG: hypothetical protein BGO87_12795 [Flavobacteriia bacterium 40-80]
MKYLIDFPSQKASALFEYNSEGLLIKYELTPGVFESEHYCFLASKFPFNTKNIESWQQSKMRNVIIRQIAEDLSFERFYELYDQKFGKKQRAKAIWDSLSDIEKAKAIAFIPKYNQHLAQTGFAKKNAETYLNQQIWNN